VKVFFVKKYVFIINGSGGVGKDSVCAAAAQYWRTQTISSITPILKLARSAGWEGEKTPQGRRFLADLKQACMAFNDLPFKYCIEQYQKFLGNQTELLFVHIREPDEIARFRQAVRQCPCYTVLVRRPALEKIQGAWGNCADDNVEQYPYDGIFINDGTLERLSEQTRHFFQNFLSKSPVVVQTTTDIALIN